METNDHAAPDPVEFWFDYSSPYAWFAFDRALAMAERHGRTLALRPFLLGAVARELGSSVLSATPAKWSYAMRDWDRLGRRTGAPFRLPDAFPIASASASRLTYWAMARGEDAAALARGLLEAAFVRGDDTGSPEVLERVAERAGLPKCSVSTALEDADARLELRERTGEAIRREIFGSPFTIVDGEPFWGGDRLQDAERLLADRSPDGSAEQLLALEGVYRSRG